MTAEKYLQDIGLENVIGEEFFNDDDKSWYKVEELMESYLQQKVNDLLSDEKIKTEFSINDAFEKAKLEGVKWAKNELLK